MAPGRSKEVLTRELRRKYEPAYSSAVRQFKKFAQMFPTEDHNIKWWDPTSIDVIMYMTYMAPALEVGSLKVYLYAIRDFVMRRGGDDPLKHYLVEMTYRGIKRSKRGKRDRRLALTVDILVKAIRAIPASMW